MCRNIRPLFNFDPPATEEDARNAALQYVRKISGYTHPSRVNQPAFEAAQWLIDRIKQVVPIWKKANWADGASEWVHPGWNSAGAEAPGCPADGDGETGRPSGGFP